MKAVLVLENGAYFIGQHFGAPVNTSGEVGESIIPIFFFVWKMEKRGF